jgi:Zn-dependent protease with chaperone function
MASPRISDIFIVEYYDGMTPVPLSGKLHVKERLMFFEPSGSDASEAVPIPYRDIIDIIKTGTKTRITLSTTVTGSAARVIVLSSDEPGRLITGNFSRQTQTGFFSRLAHSAKHASSGKKIILIVAALPLVAGIIYALLFESYRLVPRSVDQRLGRLIADHMVQEFKPHREKKLDTILDRIKKRIAPKNSRNSYTITVVENSVANAFALPNGDIIVFTGLIELSGSAEEVAGVLAHEIEHVENRHGIRQVVRVLGLSYFLHMVIGAGFEELEAAQTLSELSGLLLILRYSRRFEREADEKAVKLLNSARISSKGLLQLFQKLKERRNVPAALQWIDSHPPVESRIDYLREEVKKERFKPRPILRKGESWARIKQIKMRK